ncbi:c-type cytochrome [Massilia oculi]|uniref:C-type cytochrome n=1 Tax=Massilia hydrophila TaxID=3044279 RepID=A0ABS7YG46_9BURK|nr:c-type cytochrome [Massilia oculi]MCA1857916.1 c-type cytochrome [Massilia oculi]
MALARLAPLASLACLACLVLLAGCADEGSPPRVPGGDARQGLRLVTQYQCGACHAIPGVQGAAGRAGPALDTIGRLSYIAGRIPNQPANMQHWLRAPHALKPGTEMPPMGLTEQEARHVAAFLYTLR